MPAAITAIVSVMTSTMSFTLLLKVDAPTIRIERSGAYAIFSEGARAQLTTIRPYRMLAATGLLFALLDDRSHRRSQFLGRVNVLGVGYTDGT